MLFLFLKHPIELWCKRCDGNPVKNYVFSREYLLLLFDSIVTQILG